MTNTNKILKIWIIVSILILTTPIIIFILKFSSLPFSNKPDEWANFSIYFSNIINPILMCINILLLIKLTYEVANYNEKNLRNDMRQRAYVDISNKLFSFTVIIQSSDHKLRDLTLLRNDIISFVSTMQHLFNIENIELLTEEIDNSLIAISESEFVKGNLLFSSETDEYNEFLVMCERYDKHRSELIRKLQNSILK